MFSLWLISTHIGHLTTGLLQQRGMTYSQWSIHSSTNNNTKFTFLQTAQITRIIPTPQREC
jgi:hypothetical protein